MKIVKDLEIEKWSDFVFNNPKGNIFQTPEMFHVYMNTRNFKPMVMGVVDNNNEIKALLVSHTIRESIIGPLSTRTILQGGPIYENSPSGLKALNKLLSEYVKTMRTKTIFTEVRNLWDVRDVHEIFSIHGFTFEDHLNFLLDLEKSKEELWKGLSKKRRNRIKKAKKIGLKIKEAKNIEDIIMFYNSIKDTYKNAKIPLAHITLFKSIFENLTNKNMAKIFLAVYENTVIGGILVLIYRETVYDYYAGSVRKYLHMCPNDLLTWYAIEWSCKKGFKIFDFGGAGQPNKPYGVRDFKKQFGGELVNFGRFRLVHQPLKMQMARLGFNIYQKLKIW